MILYLSEDEARDLHEICEVMELTVDEFVSIAVAEYLERMKNESGTV